MPIRIPTPPKTASESGGGISTGVLLIGAGAMLVLVAGLIGFAIARSRQKA
jgi:hypothetical protein